MIKKQSGFTLSEILISSLLGLIIAAAAIQMFEINKGMYSLQKAITSTESSARFAIEIISDDLRIAGYDPLNSNNNTKTPISNSKTVEGGNQTKSDSIGVQYQKINDSVEQDCSGNSLNTIVNTYDVLSGTLRCNGIAMIENVVSFQLLYGIDYNSDNQPDRYLEATQAKTYNANDDQKIIAIRVGIVVSSENPVPGRKGRDIKNLNESSVNYNDGRVYSHYTSTVLLNNML